ncbi:Cytochrome P450 [Sulfidibacter corallicola]|uniref:Cytochrome P450 n=1 Tax=Sulfidibacter corallicola TaxID=2818388 RepID=A0A8A4TM98_SULCO|nr:cytochrome P450 [Sulfidibacter corallicola]QTD50001.1 cytochrome P450 [Sulfidibacter corallicola]
MTFPPGPALPESEQLRLMRTAPIDFIESCHRDFGSIFTLQLGRFGNTEVTETNNGKWVIVTKPDDVKTLFKADPDRVLAGAANKILFGGKTQTGGIIRLDGRAHAEIRRVYQPIFTGASMKAYIPAIIAAAERQAKAWSRTRPFPLLPELQRITIRVIAHSILGFPREELEILCPRLMCLEDAAIKGQQRVMVERELSRIVTDHIERYAGADMSHRVDVFARLTQVQKSDGRRLSAKELHDELITLLKAGFGTTSNALAWLFGCILRDPAIYIQVVSELERVTQGAAVARDHVERLTYLDAVIKEMLRLCPSIGGFTGVRYLADPLELGGYPLPAGTMVAVATHVLHRDPDVYEDPLVFRPERFLEHKVSIYSWAPFGGGNRMCVGKSFAIQEMKVVVATLLTRLEMRLDQPIGKPEVQGFFCAPSGRGPLVRVRDRIAGLTRG